MKETQIDSMKYRKSTHLAGIDVETIVNEKGNCVVTIKEAYYDKGVDVSGNKSDGYFIEFVEDIKPMMVNSINRKTINAVVKAVKNCTSAESRFLPNWIGMKIELSFDETVKMMGKITGGIRVKPTQFIKEKKAITDANFEKALLSINAGNYTADKLKEDFLLTDEQLGKL
tara:strand:- start:37 stop:549 length:513 start_codon:yes stop_codon:yes gene_type:complete